MVGGYYCTMCNKLIRRGSGMDCTVCGRESLCEKCFRNHVEVRIPY